jgi:branched-chain amino acid aminotransferase
MQNYIAGRWYDEDDSLISALIPGVLNGESVYEVVRTYNGLPFAFRKHFDRLKRSAALMSMEVPFTCKELNSIILEGIDKNRPSQSGDLRIRIVLFGNGENVLPAVIYALLPSVSKDIYELGVKIAISLTQNPRELSSIRG